jgi:hypothetical protein
MIFIYIFFLVGIVFYTNKRPVISLVDLKNKSSGMDERPNNYKSNSTISMICSNIFKLDMMRLLQSGSLNENQKLAIIYNSEIFDDLKPNLIMAPNISKGLKW